MTSRIFFLLISMVLLSCSGDSNRSSFQQWKDISLAVETRPPQIRAGMMEFLVVANRGERKVAHDLIVSLRIGEVGKWVQAIQDGHVGVYRRALRVVDPSSDVLQVHVRYGAEETVLKFPLNYALSNSRD